MSLVLGEGFRWSVACGGLFSCMTYLLRRPPCQAEDVVEPGLVAGELGSHAAGFGPASGGGVDQHGLADGGKLAEQLADGQVQPLPAGAGTPEVGELGGQHAGETPYPDGVG